MKGTRPNTKGPEPDTVRAEPVEALPFFGRVQKRKGGPSTSSGRTAIQVTSRPLTPGEIALARSVFGDAIDYAPVRIVRRKWFPFQGRGVAMAPCGHIHFHPRSHLWSEDFSADIDWRKALFIHEMAHVWQAQQRGKYYLPLMRHPFCRYAYALKPGRKFELYGLEQQAEIVKHAFMLREGMVVRGAPTLDQYRSLLPFGL